MRPQSKNLPKKRYDLNMFMNEVEKQKTTNSELNVNLAT